MSNHFIMKLIVPPVNEYMTARGTVASFARPRTRALFASAVPVDP